MAVAIAQLPRTGYSPCGPHAGRAREAPARDATLPHRPQMEDDDRPHVKVRQAVRRRTRKGPVLVPPKSRHGRRSVPLPARACGQAESTQDACEPSRLHEHRLATRLTLTTRPAGCSRRRAPKRALSGPGFTLSGIPSQAGYSTPAATRFRFNAGLATTRRAATSRNARLVLIARRSQVRILPGIRLSLPP